MELISLEQVFRIVKPGVPLPFGVRDNAGQLLLSRGHVLETQDKVIELLNRGMFVDAEEVRRYMNAGSTAIAPPPVRFSNRWEAVQRKLGLLLRASGEPEFLKHIGELVEQILNFPEATGDQLIFHVLRHDHSECVHYPEAHSLHVAALCHLISRRLGWPEPRRRSLIGAALTMNLAMIELQGRLAGQQSPLSPVQRREIEAHPQAGVALLRAAGLRDADWLRAVEQHHELPGGQGYPQKIETPDELGLLIHLCDFFTAKHSPRAGRLALPAQQAARAVYEESGKHPLAAALIKECGIYPPGAYVKLASGELAVVTRRGANPKEPLVAAVTNARGEALSRPVERDTARMDRNIVGVVSEKSIMTHFSADQLYP